MDKKLTVIIAVVIIAAAWIVMSNNGQPVEVQAPENNEAVLSCQAVPDPPVTFGVAPTGTQEDYNAWEEEYGARYESCYERHYDKYQK